MKEGTNGDGITEQEYRREAGGGVSDDEESQGGREGSYEKRHGRLER